MYYLLGLGLDPSQYPPVPGNMQFTVTETGEWFTTQIFNVNSAQALSDYVQWVNANVDSNVKTSQDGINRAQSMGVISPAIAAEWMDFILNPSKYSGGSGGSGGGSGGGGGGTTVVPSPGPSPAPQTKSSLAQIAEGLLLAGALGFIVWAVMSGSKASAPAVAVSRQGVAKGKGK